MPRRKAAEPMTMLVPKPIVDGCEVGKDRRRREVERVKEDKKETTDTSWENDCLRRRE
jgi:hypothetical protein